MKLIFQPILGILIFVLGFNALAEIADEQSLNKYCVAVRGNGGRGGAHFSALARTHEQYGMLWGIAGASSGSVISFIVDSIYGNPLLYDCDGARCDPQETAARAALLMKSELSRGASLAEFPESATFLLYFRIVPMLQEHKVEQLLEVAPDKGLAALRMILSSASIQSSVNHEILEILDQSQNPIVVAKDIVNGLFLGAEFKVDNPNALIRPGIVSYRALIEFLGKVGDFYALQGDFADSAGMNDYFKACATPGHGKPWSEVQRLPAGQSTCGQTYSQLIKNYYLAANARGYASQRLNQSIGTNLHTLVGTALIGGQSAQRWQDAREKYLKGLPNNWAPQLADLQVGYFGTNEDLDRLQSNPLRLTDIKTQKNYALNNQTWRDALSTSLAEPSISRGVELSTHHSHVAIGGWIDLQPVQPLLSIGCQEVVLQTTEGSILGGYSDQVLGLFNPTQAERLKFNSLSDTESSVSQALTRATAINCIPYDKIAISDLEGLGNAGWNAPLYSRSAFFQSTQKPDPRFVQALTQTGCAPGVE